MRKYITAFDGEEVDLDDYNIYNYLPNDIKMLDDKMFKEIGYALCYMNNFHPEFFSEYAGIDYENSQKNRVMKLIENFCDNRENNYNNVMWYKEQVFLFQDEIENMC